jgi:hypothetical protein
MTDQWLRPASPIVSGAKGSGIELADPALNNTLRGRFTV